MILTKFNSLLILSLPILKSFCSFDYRIPFLRQHVQIKHPQQKLPMRLSIYNFKLCLKLILMSLCAVNLDFKSVSMAFSIILEWECRFMLFCFLSFSSFVDDWPKIVLSLVLALYSFFVAFRKKLCLEIGDNKKAQTIKITCVKPPISSMMSKRL